MHYYYSTSKASHGWVPVAHSSEETVIQMTMSASTTSYVNSIRKKKNNKQTKNIGYVHTRLSGKQGDKMLDVSSECFV